MSIPEHRCMAPDTTRSEEATAEPAEFENEDVRFATLAQKIAEARGRGLGFFEADEVYGPASERESAGANPPARRNALVHGIFHDAHGGRCPAFLKTFENPALCANERAALAAARERGVGPRVFDDIDPASDGCASPTDDGPARARILCLEDAGVSLERVLLEDAEIPHRIGHASGPRGLRLSEFSASERALFCSKVLYDLCWQLDALQNGPFAESEPLVHGDIKLANICIAAYAPAPDAVRATLIDFESTARSAGGSMRSPRTPAYARIVHGCAERPGDYDLGCLALVLYQLEHGPLARIAAPRDGIFDELETEGAFHYSRLPDGQSIAVGEPDELPALSDRLAQRLGLTPLASWSSDPAVLRRARALVHGRRFLDVKDLIDILDALGWTSGSHIRPLALAISELYDRACAEGAWPGNPVDENDEELFKQNFEQAMSWERLLASIGLKIIEAESARPEDRIVNALSPAEHLLLEEHEHARWLRGKRADGWRPFNEVRDGAELARRGLDVHDPAQAAEVKRALDGMRVNLLMKPYKRLSPAERRMNELMVDALIPALRDRDLLLKRV